MPAPTGHQMRTLREFRGALSYRRAGTLDGVLERHRIALNRAVEEEGQA